ncbi:MAG: helix-turn-helix domain-containing protein [Tannerellaceae bacterium]|nr:helix-turn-helix domain-containing protein [Tannerellaceae bacterium]
MNYDVAWMVILGASSICVVCIAAIVAALKIPLTYRRKLYFAFITSVVVLLYPISIVVFRIDSALPVLYFVTMLVYFYAMLPQRALLYCILASSLMLSAVVISVVWRYNDVGFEQEIHMPYLPTLVFYVINVAPLFFLICHALYYIRLFGQIETEHLMDIIKREDDKRGKQLLDAEDREEDKYNMIFALIEKYMLIRRPYLNANFSLTKMSHDLNVNSNYISKAINLHRGMNFSNYINVYRVANVKEMILSQSKKYTLRHIYISSGFKSQSSFNKAFKQSEVMTPSEFCAIYKK